jgi:Na+-driven multidrug efflux pump
MIGVALLNIILDPIFMFGWFGFPRLELQGAALASVVSYALSLFVSLYVLRFRLRFVSLSVMSRGIAANWLQVIRLALPAIGNNLVFPASAAVTTWLLARYGSDAVAGFNVAVRIEAVVMVPITALTFALASFTGQNSGAGRPDRVRTALRVSYRLSWIGGIASFFVCAVSALLFVPVFTTDPDAMVTARFALLIVPLSYPMLYVVMVISAAGNGMGHTMPALIMSLSRLLFLFVPLAWLSSTLMGQAGIFVAMAVSNVLVSISAVRFIERYISGIELSADLRG